MSTILIIILVILLLGGFGGYHGYSRYGGAGLGGVLGLVLIILVVLWLVGGLRACSANSETDRIERAGALPYGRRLACRHEETIALGSAEGDIGVDLGQSDAPAHSGAIHNEYPQAADSRGGACQQARPHRLERPAPRQGLRYPSRARGHISNVVAAWIREAE